MISQRRGSSSLQGEELVDTIIGIVEVVIALSLSENIAQTLESINNGIQDK